jgi:hypothetical protein
MAPMGMLLEINRDFPFQIPLPFDEAGMEVLEWLDDAPFESDMYVDLPENWLLKRRRIRFVAEAVTNAVLAGPLALSRRPVVSCLLF